VSDNPTMTDPDHAVRPLQADKSLGELFGDLTGDMGRLFRQEVQLAKVEARKAGGMEAVKKEQGRS